MQKDIEVTDEIGDLQDRIDDVVQSIGRGIKTFVIPMPWGNAAISAGPYMDFPYEDKAYFGIKCAAEINMQYMYALDIKDFGLPDQVEAERAAFLAIAAMRVGMIPYIGCMGGLGRTGTLLGILAKTALTATSARFYGLRLPWSIGGDPVDWVRKFYRPQAIETRDQEDFVRAFDVKWLAKMAFYLR